ncbi:MAG: hypothetical protein WC565_02870 [Parcubacteria group bacterium]
MVDEARTRDESDVSERCKAWFGDKTRDELLHEIDRIITTDRPALAKLYDERDALALENKRLRKAIGRQSKDREATSFESTMRPGSATRPSDEKLAQIVAELRRASKNSKTVPLLSIRVNMAMAADALESLGGNAA